MLTAIGRASVRRVLVRSSALAAPRTTTAIPTYIKAAAPSSRTFTTSLWSRFPAKAEKPAIKKTKASATKKTAAKPKVAKKKKKVAVKAAPKPKKAKKVLTPEEQLKKDIRELKVAALLKEPKKLPETSWTVFSSLNVKSGGGGDLGSQVKVLASEYKALSSSELDRLIETAEKNKHANNASYRAWVESHSPLEIHEANNARRQLRRKLEGRRTSSAHRSSIRDERQPKGPLRAYALFCKSRWASGDFSGSVTESAKQLGQEFKALGPAEKKAYDDLAAADLERYAKEVRSVLGKEIKRSESP